MGIELHQHSPKHLSSNEEPAQMEKQRPGKKVLIIGLAKSGTSILLFRVAEGMKPCKSYFEPGGKFGQQDVSFHEKVCRQRKNAVVKIVFHAGQPDSLDRIIPLYDKVVWIVRDPRDQLISTFFYIWYFRHNPDPEQFRHSLDLTLQKEANPSAIAFHTLHPLLRDKRRFAALYNPTIEFTTKFKDKVLVIKYEEFIIGKVRSLEEYLGIRINNKILVEGYLDRVSRSKSYENWRRWFCSEDVSFYAEDLNPYLGALGYDVNDWKLESTPSLSAREGSDYMSSLFHKTPNQEIAEHIRWFVKRVLDRFSAKTNG